MQDSTISATPSLPDSVAAFCHELAQLASQPQRARDYCRSVLSEARDPFVVLLSAAAHSVFADIVIYSYGYEDLEKALGARWSEELTRVQSQVLADFIIALRAVAGGQTSNASLTDSFATLVQAWQRFDREDAERILQASSSLR